MAYKRGAGGRSSEVERQLPKLNVVGSIPIARSSPFGTCDWGHAVLDPPENRAGKTAIAKVREAEAHITAQRDRHWKRLRPED